jgi:hypothetical protein
MITIIPHCSDSVRCCTEVLGTLFNLMAPAFAVAAFAAAVAALVLLEGNPAAALSLFAGRL